MDSKLPSPHPLLRRNTGGNAVSLNTGQMSDKQAVSKNTKGKEKPSSNLTLKNLNSRWKTRQEQDNYKKTLLAVPSMVSYIIDVLKGKESHAKEGVEKFLKDESEDRTVDDCVRWHLLLEAVEFDPTDDTEDIEARVQLSEMLIEHQPYLAFENPYESDASKKIYEKRCKDQKGHKGIKNKKIPFYVAARCGNSKIIAAMISSGRNFYDRNRSAGKECAEDLRDRPKYSNEEQPLVKVIQEIDPESTNDDTALMLAAKANHESLETMTELLKVEHVPFLPEDKTFDYALKSGLLDIVELFLSKQDRADIFVTSQTIIEAVGNLSKPIDDRRSRQGISSTESKRRRSKIAQRLVEGARNEQIFNRAVVETIIKKGSMEIWKVQRKNLLQGDLRSSLVHLAVVHQKHDFVEMFIDENPTSLGQEWAYYEGGEAKYPLWYNNHFTEVITDATFSSSQNTEIRHTVVTKMIHVVPEGEKLSDIFYNSDESVGELCFDMSPFNSATYRVSELVDSLIWQSRTRELLSYEATLRYAEFPPLDMRAEERERLKDNCHLQRSHTEVINTLLWLKKKGVKTIIKLKVPDRLVNPHDDFLIAKAVDEFNVEILDWRVLDFPISSFSNDAKKRIKELHLYSSGNRAVISHWFSDEGIGSLEKLDTLEIKIVQETCTSKYRKKLTDEIEEKLRNLKRKIELSKVESVSWYPTPKLADLNEIAHRVAPKLARWLKNLSAKVEEEKLRTGTYKPTKVAILDNGILSIPPNTTGDNSVRAEKEIDAWVTGTDHDHSNEEDTGSLNGSGTLPDQPDDNRSILKRIKEGRSFVDGDTRLRPWLFASNPHGTQMANLICAIDPCCEIYVARVAEDAFGITPKRVQKAIAWARSKQVDIISMSFVIGETTAPLSEEINLATQDGIVMTCSTHDEGSRVAKAYPASLKGDSTSLIVLAACDEYGRIIRQVDEGDYHYLIQGRNVAAGVIPFLQSEETITGSSVATALAAGLCSLILTCDRLANPEREYSRNVGVGSRHETVTKHLDDMLASSKAKFILLEKFGKIDVLGRGRSGNPSAQKVLTESFIARNRG